jgi:DME family drug/metabolite transporter
VVGPLGTPPRSVARLRPVRRLSVIPGVALVSVAAAMWGTDALFRRPLAQSTSPATIVFGEHVVLVLVTLPFLLPSLAALRRAGTRYLLAAIAVGAGASATATILFTQAFVHGNPITPVVLQKVQPLIAVAGAWLVLGEEPRRRFAWFLLPALTGVWLIAFPHPFDVSANGLTPILEALGAAVLWGLGTVFGRYLGRELAFEQVTTVRFGFGLVACAVALPLVGAGAYSSVHDSLWIVVLALVTGAISLTLYYYGLRRTPATLAALAELAFPVTASVVGYLAFGATLRWTQWLGVLVTVAAVSLLPLRRGEIVRVPARDTRLEPAAASA